MQRNETELLRLARNGDRDAYWQVVEPHLRVVFLTAKSILRNFEDAEETAQESLLKAMQSIAQFRGDASMKTWLVRITVNESLMRIRKNHRHLYRAAEEAIDGDKYLPMNFADWREIPSEVLERKELRDALNSALASLPEKYREVLTLRDISQLSNRETAHALGLSIGGVKTRLLRARLQMRDLLAPGLNGSWLKNGQSTKTSQSSSLPT